MQRLFLIFLIVCFHAAVQSVTAVAGESRFALVIGNAAYKASALATPLNNASLIAQSLQEAGFEVTAQRNLDDTKLHNAFSDFSTKLGNAGSDVVAVVYFAGHGLQSRGENFLLPVDADVNAADGTPARAVSLSDQMRAFAALHLKASIFILDEACIISPSGSGSPAAGFAWVEPEADTLVAFSAAPGTVVRCGKEGVDPYAKALAENIRDSSQTPAELFERVRLRVSELTMGAQMPWHASKIDPRFVLFAQNPNAPARTEWRAYVSNMRAQPLKRIGVRDAYFATLLRDTLDGYADFLADYWQDPMANRVQALLAARREAITWWRTYQRNTPEAYWTYLDRYPAGPHAFDARGLLSRLGAPNDPPAKFTRLEYDVPPPLPDELPYLVKPGLMLDDAQFSFAPPPQMPLNLVGPQLQLSNADKPDTTAGTPTGGTFVVPDAALSASGAPPPSPPPPSPLESGLVSGAIGSPIRQGDKFAAPASPPADVTGEAAKGGPVVAAPPRQETVPSSQSPAIDPKGTDQAVTSPDVERETTGKKANPAPVTGAPTAGTPTARVQGNPQGKPAGPPVPVRRSTSPPERVFGSIGSQSNGQPTPLRGSVPPPGKPPVSARSPSDIQWNPAVQNAPARLRNQPVSTVRTPTPAPRAAGVPTAKPNPTTRLPKAACSDLDGKQTCR